MRALSMALRALPLFAVLGVIFASTDTVVTPFSANIATPVWTPVCTNTFTAMTARSCWSFTVTVQKTVNSNHIDGTATTFGFTIEVGKNPAATHMLVTTSSSSGDAAATSVDAKTGNNIAMVCAATTADTFPCDVYIQDASFALVPGSDGYSGTVYVEITETLTSADQDVSLTSRDPNTVEFAVLLEKDSYKTVTSTLQASQSLLTFADASLMNVEGVPTPISRRNSNNGKALKYARITLGLEGASTFINTEDIKANMGGSDFYPCKTVPDYTGCFPVYTHINTAEDCEKSQGVWSEFVADLAPEMTTADPSDQFIPFNAASGPFCFDALATSWSTTTSAYTASNDRIGCFYENGNYHSVSSEWPILTSTMLGGSASAFASSTAAAIANGNTLPPVPGPVFAYLEGTQTACSPATNPCGPSGGASPLDLSAATHADQIVCSGEPDFCSVATVDAFSVVDIPLDNEATEPAVELTFSIETTSGFEMLKITVTPTGGYLKMCADVGKYVSLIAESSLTESFRLGLGDHAFAANSGNFVGTVVNTINEALLAVAVTVDHDTTGGANKPFDVELQDTKVVCILDADAVITTDLVAPSYFVQNSYYTTSYAGRTGSLVKTTDATQCPETICLESTSAIKSLDIASTNLEQAENFVYGLNGGDDTSGDANTDLLIQDAFTVSKDFVNDLPTNKKKGFVKWISPVSNCLSAEQAAVVMLLRVTVPGDPTRRMLLQTSSIATSTARGGEGTASAVVRYDISPAELLAATLGVPLAYVTSWNVQLEISDTEACMPLEDLKAAARIRILAALQGAASAVLDVSVLNLILDKAHVRCTSSERRLVVDSESVSPTVTVEALVVFDPEVGGSPWLDTQRFEDATGVLSLEQTQPNNAVDVREASLSPNGHEEQSGGSSVLVPIVISVSCAMVVLVGGVFAARRSTCRSSAAAEPFEIMHVPVAESGGLKSQTLKEAIANDHHCTVEAGLEVVDVSMARRRSTAGSLRTSDP